jgi:hypothetical protein
VTSAERKEADKAIRMIIDMMVELVEEGAKDNIFRGIPASYLHLALEGKLGIDFHTCNALIGQMVNEGKVTRTPSHLLQPVGPN